MRMVKELERLEFDPPHGISVWAKGDSTCELEAVITGPEDSPYAKGSFRVTITIPDRYPFEPPKVRFVTPIYHPNVDDGGRICLDVLKMPPKGSWKPAQNISTVLTSIYLLMMEPNPDDPLMADIAKQYREDRQSFIAKAEALTKSIMAAPEEQSTQDNSTKRARSSEAEEDGKNAKLKVSA